MTTINLATGRSLQCSMLGNSQPKWHISSRSMGIVPRDNANNDDTRLSVTPYSLADLINQEARGDFLSRAKIICQSRIRTVDQAALI